MKRLSLLFSLILCAVIPTLAQEWITVHKHYADTDWAVPMKIADFKEFYISDNRDTLNAPTLLTDETQLIVPFSIETIDSISFANDLSDDEKGHNKYKVFSLYITTLNQTPLLVKEEWIPCHFSLDGKGEYSDFSGTGRIRGRGNSTWNVYPKKPYRFKLDTKSKLLGMEKAKDWNLLANYRDVTDLMNAFAFEAARCMGMPNTNHTRFVEVFLNEKYIGLYQLTEKIEVDKNRVNIAKEGGVLLSFDKDDGPELSPEATDNFWSKIYHLPMSVKHPEDPSAETLNAIREDFAELERAILLKDYDLAASLMDMESFIHILQLHEYLDNVELEAPRSLYMYKDLDGKYTFGPAWDWDAGYDFSWTNWETTHNFFGNTNTLIFGTSPATHENADRKINDFFVNMFANEQFVTQYKQLWREVSDTIFTHSWNEMEKYLTHLNSGTYKREFAKWNIKNKDVATEIGKMKNWLTTRLEYLNGIVENYPSKVELEVQEYDIVDGVMRIQQTVIASKGYDQNVTINIDPAQIAKYLGWLPYDLIAINSDGSMGRNTAAKAFGAWFDSNSNTNDWAKGHVYVETDDMYTLYFGCHPNNCTKGDKHTVRLRYLGQGGKTLLVEINFVVVGDDGESGDEDEPGDDDEPGNNNDPDNETTTDITQEVVADYNYNQPVGITINHDAIVDFLGGEPTSCIVLNTDGSEGKNTASKTYGAWFDANGDTNIWENGHVYLESEDMFNWAFGSHPDNCSAGDSHTVRIQYTNGDKKYIVQIHFSIVSKEDTGDDNPDIPEDPYDNVIRINKSVKASDGYSQHDQIIISQEQVTEYLGGKPSYVVALNADGSIGSNTAAKTYGAWFDANGNTNPWADGHVYIESDNMYILSFGCHPDNCAKGHEHVVKLLYAGPNGKELIVEITFTIE